jgi:hypothetical protein
MRIFKATFKNTDGQIKESAKRYVDFFDHNKFRHKIPIFDYKGILKIPFLNS